jgi:hypothetical protein
LNSGLHTSKMGSASWATPPVHFALVILEMRVSLTICLGWPQIAIILFSASQVARITCLSQWCLAKKNVYFQVVTLILIINSRNVWKF